MRIGFDARMIDHPGVGRYIKCLLSEMIRQDKDDEFVLFGDPESTDLKGLASSDNVRISKWTTPIYSVWEQIFHPFDREKLDLVHIPHFNVPFRCKTKMVVTIHDLIYLLFSESAPSHFHKWYVKNFMAGIALKKAESIIAISENTKRDLARMFGQEYSKKISVIYEAADRDFRIVRDPERESEVRRKYGLKNKLVLYVGSVRIHKNVDLIFKLFLKLKKEFDIPHQLVICGRWDDKKTEYLKPYVDGKSVKHLGEISNEDLVTIYNISDILINLPKYEGFGLTILEAMQSGIPVVASETSSLPEVARDAAYLIQPEEVRGDMDKAANIVYNVLVNKELRDGMISSGLVNAKRFSWEKTAAETLDIYHKS